MSLLSEDILGPVIPGVPSTLVRVKVLKRAKNVKFKSKWVRSIMTTFGNQHIYSLHLIIKCDEQALGSGGDRSHALLWKLK
jgi:hypothetical protein